VVVWYAFQLSELRQRDAGMELRRKLRTFCGARCIVNLC